MVSLIFFVLAFSLRTAKLTTHRYNLLEKAYHENFESTFVHSNGNKRGVGKMIIDKENGTLPLDLNQISLPLNTKSRWIVDSTGKRVKFSCINWISHLEALVPEGLADFSADELSERVRHMGFNCVRFTFSNDLIFSLNESISPFIERYMSDSSRQNFLNKNQEFISHESTVLEVFGYVLNSMKAYNLFVVLDNHIGTARWCCNLGDGNRWFGERNFDVEEWLLVLSNVANLVNTKGWTNVVGIGLRNEPQKITLYRKRYRAEWYHYMRLGATAVARANPQLLVIVSGYESGSQLSQLKSTPFLTEDMPESLSQKIVYESHYYNLFYIKPFWYFLPYSWACKIAWSFLDGRSGFLLDETKEPTAPIWFSEFGLDVENFNDKRSSPDEKWMQCVTDWMVNWDVDFSYWVLHSRYYKRDSTFDYKESWGLDSLKDTDPVKNHDVMRKLHKVMLVHKRPFVGN